LSDREAAERLGFSLKALRKVIDAHGLCLRLNRRRRLTEAQFLRLQDVLCLSPSTDDRTASGACAAPFMADASITALELVTAEKRRRSALNSNPNCLSGRFSATDTSRPSQRPSSRM